MRDICTDIVSHIVWAYSPKSHLPIYNFVQKFSSEYGCGTGTLINLDGMLDSLAGRMVLSCAHMYLCTNKWGSDDKNQMQNDMLGLGISYSENEKSEKIFHETPTKRTLKEFSKVPEFYADKKNRLI